MAIRSINPWCCKVCGVPVSGRHRQLCVNCAGVARGVSPTTPTAMPSPVGVRTRQELIKVMTERAARGEHLRHPGDQLPDTRTAESEGEADWQVEAAKRWQQEKSCARTD